MKPRQIEAFKAIIECGSISKAAQTLSISQPAVTKTLQLLEHDIGLTLFTRTSRGLIPTAEARAFYTEVERTFAGLAYLRTFTQDLRMMKHGRVVVSVIPALSERWLPEVVSDFLSDYPDASLSFHATSSPHTAQLVGERRIDLGIAQSRIEDGSIERRQLFALEAVCIMPSGHPLASKEAIQPADLNGETFVALSANDVIRVQTDRLLQEAGVVVKRQIEVSLGVTARELVSQGFGLAIVDSGTARYNTNPRIVIRPFLPATLMRIYLLRPRGRPQSFFEEKFIEYCVKHAPKPLFPELLENEVHDEQ